MTNDNKRGFELVSNKNRFNKNIYDDIDFNETYIKYPNIPLPNRLDNTNIYEFKTYENITLTPYTPKNIYFDIKAYMPKNEILFITTNLTKNNIFNVTLKQIYNYNDYLLDTNIGIILVNYTNEPIYLPKDEVITTGMFIKTYTNEVKNNE